MFRQQTVREIALEEALREEAPPKPKQEFTEKDFERINGTYSKAFRVFATGEGTIPECSTYKIKGDELWFIRKKLIKGAIRQTYRRSLVAKKINGVIFGNSTELWGRRSRRNSDPHRAKQLNIQRDLSQVIPMVPFNLFKESNLDIMKLEVVDRGPQEDLDFGFTTRENKTILQHFTGALLFKIEDAYFLFDLDRNEVPKKQFNAWMSQLPRPCTSIADAYLSLKPKEVYEAEKFLGHHVQRQGEWFFIPVQGKFENDESRCKERRGWSSETEWVASLQAKGNRAHLVSFCSKEGYVKGTVTHEGFEHKPIELKTWCKPIPNSAVESFKISGAID